MYLFTPTVFLEIIMCLGSYSFDFLKPSYVSDWKYIKSQSGAGSEVVFVHGLNVLPYKVVTEVFVNDNGRHYIFHAMGSGGDDDFDSTSGGIIYLYDEYKVRILAPSKRTGGYNVGVSIYTGSYRSWDGPKYISNTYTEVMVRVKVFIPCDFPTPDFQSEWTNLSIYDAMTFKEITHTLDGYPDFVVLQVKNNANYVSEGLGSTSILETFAYYHHTGGVIYGFSQKHIRVWYPSYSSNRQFVCIMCFADGWGLNNIVNAKNGSFRVLAWKIPGETTHSIIKTLPHESTASPQNHEFIIDIDTNNSFVTVEIEALDGSNEGFRFYGVGSTFNDGLLKPFGGLIYAYNETNLVYWTPRVEANGHLINIGGHWGINSGSNTNINNQASVSGIIRVIVFNFSSEEICCKNETIDEPSTEVFKSGLKYRDIMNYTCKYGYNVTGGDESRQCRINGKWDGNALNCSKIVCPREVINIKGVTANITGFGYRDNVTYECDNDNPVQVSGDFHRSCLANATWSGTDPVCEPCKCPCYLVSNNNSDTLMEEIEAIKQQLSLNKEKTSRFLRSKISAPDKRKSAESIGYLGITFIIVITLVIIVPDIPILFRGIKVLYNRVFYRRASRVFPEKKKKKKKKKKQTSN